MATRIEKQEEKAKKELAKLKEMRRREKEKERQKIKDEQRYKKIGKVVEKMAKTKITNFETFSAYIAQYGWKIQETQKEAPKEAKTAEIEVY